MVTGTVPEMGLEPFCLIAALDLSFVVAPVALDAGGSDGLLALWALFTVGSLVSLALLLANTSAETTGTGPARPAPGVLGQRDADGVYEAASTLALLTVYAPWM